MNFVSFNGIIKLEIRNNTKDALIYNYDLPNYTKDEFYNISISILFSRYGISKDLGHYLTDQVYNLTEKPYIRTVERLEVLMGAETNYNEIDRILNTLIKYS